MEEEELRKQFCEILSEMGKEHVQIRISNKNMGGRYWWVYGENIEGFNVTIQNVSLLDAVKLMHNNFKMWKDKNTIIQKWYKVRG